MNIYKLIASIAICLIVGFLGSIFTTKSIPAWYKKLKKPSFNPPNWIFGPVWTTLYVLMGISFYIVWNKNAVGSNVAIIIFLIQLFLNFLWSLLFFGLKKPFYAFIEIVVLWILILINIIYFFRIAPVSAYLLIPYIFWVSFAAILNYKIFRLNR
jgi:benzodiazapine receptor